MSDEGIIHTYIDISYIYRTYLLPDNKYVLYMCFWGFDLKISGSPMRYNAVRAQPSDVALEPKM